MIQKRKAFIIAGCALLCLILLRETGVADLNTYRSTLTTFQTVDINQKKRGKTENVNCQLSLRSGNDIILVASFNADDDRPYVVIDATLAPPVYSGNYFLPFSKAFRMSYVCNFKTVNAPSKYEAQGKIQGELTASIQGFCSRRKARELALDYVQKKVLEYFEKGLSL